MVYATRGIIILIKKVVDYKKGLPISVSREPPITTHHGIRRPPEAPLLSAAFFCAVVALDTVVSFV